MKIQTASLLLALTVLPFSAAHACDMPGAPPTPDGNSATLDDMISAQGEVKAFQGAYAIYLECVDDQMSGSFSDLHSAPTTPSNRIGPPR